MHKVRFVLQVRVVYTGPIMNTINFTQIFAPPPPPAPELIEIRSVVSAVKHADKETGKHIIIMRSYYSLRVKTA
jgi:hypothetical protein